MVDAQAQASVDSFHGVPPLLAVEGTHGITVKPETVNNVERTGRQDS